MPSQFNDLPHEVLHLIFDLVNPKQYATLRSVNTAWNSLLSPHVFHSIIIKYFPIRRTVGSILEDMERSFDGEDTFGIPIGHHIQQLALLNDDTTSDQLQRIPTLCPNITSLTISSEILNSISPQSQQEQEHGVVRSALGELDTRRTLLVGFFTALGGPKVTKLRLDGTTSYPMLNEIILPTLSHLVELDIGSMVWKLDDDLNDEYPIIEPFMDTIDLMNLIQDSCPCLEALSMAKRDLSTMEQDLGISTSDGLAGWISTIRVWPRLTSLTLNLNITHQLSRYWLVPTLMYLAIRLPALQRLQISSKNTVFSMGCSNLIKDERLVDLLRAGLNDSSSGGKREWPYIFGGLQSINLEGFSLGHLERMILFGYDESIHGLAITPSMQSIKICRSSIIFGHGNDDTHAPRIYFLRHCISHNPLTSLELLNCGGLNERHLADALTFGTNRLETLGLYRLKSIYIDSLLDWCPHLQLLQLIQCNIYGSAKKSATEEIATTTASPASESTIKNQHHPLKTLNLHGSNIKDIGIFGLISQRCRQLSVLNFSDISIFDSTTTQNGKTRNTTKRKSERLGGLIYMPYTKLSLCTMDHHVFYYGPRFKTQMIDVLLLPATANIGDRPASLVYSHTQGNFILREMISPGKRLQKLLYKMTSLDDDDYGDGDGDDGDLELQRSDQLILQQVKRNGLVTIRCKDIQDLVISDQVYHGPLKHGHIL